jgi:hypothetical protein
MKRRSPVILLALFLSSGAAGTCGCAPAKQAARPDLPPEVSVRVPLVESPKVSLEAEESKRWRPPAEPRSVGEEYNGRWLTLIEVEINPPEAERPPEASEP